MCTRDRISLQVACYQIAGFFMTSLMDDPAMLALAFC